MQDDEHLCEASDNSTSVLAPQIITHGGITIWWRIRCDVDAGHMPHGPLPKRPKAYQMRITCPTLASRCSDMVSDTLAA